MERIFNTPVADISFQDILSQHENREGLLINLSPVMSISCSRERSNQVALVMKFYTQLPETLRGKVVFLGSKEEISRMVDYQSDLGEMLLSNPSVSEKLIA